MRFRKWAAVAMACLILVACCAPAPAQEPDGPQGVIGFVVAVDAEARTVEFDEVEWLTGSDTERLAELGVDPEEVLNDYYINNPDESTVTYAVADDAVFKLIDWMDPNVPKSEGDFEAFAAHYGEQINLLYAIVVEDGVIQSADEIFTP